MAGGGRGDGRHVDGEGATAHGRREMPRYTEIDAADGDGQGGAGRGRAGAAGVCTGWDQKAAARRVVASRARSHQPGEWGWEPPPITPRH